MGAKTDHSTMLKSSPLWDILPTLSVVCPSSSFSWIFACTGGMFVLSLRNCLITCTWVRLQPSVLWRDSNDRTTLTLQEKSAVPGLCVTILFCCCLAVKIPFDLVGHMKAKSVMNCWKLHQPKRCDPEHFTLKIKHVDCVKTQLHNTINMRSFNALFLSCPHPSLPFLLSSPFLSSSLLSFPLLFSPFLPSALLSSPLVGMCTAAECLVVCAVLNINWESVEDLSPKW